MALPKKKKIQPNIDPPRIGREFLKYGMDRIEELMRQTDEKTVNLPRTIDFEDMDNSLFEFVKDGNLSIIIDDKKLPTVYLENERWGEFSKTWTLMDGDKNIPTPYLTIRRINKEPGTRMGNKYRVPQPRAFTYLEVPILDEGQTIFLRYKIPQPTNVDLIYDVSLFTKFRVDVNDMDKRILQEFASLQSYIFVKGNPMVVKLESMTEQNTVQQDKGDRLYVSKYQLRVLGFLQDENEFDIVKTTRKPRFGVDLL